jgi:outer membrane protein
MKSIIAINALKKALRLRIVVTLLFFLSPQLFAETVSIAVVSISKIMQEAPQAERSSINLKAKFLPIEEKLAEQSTEIEKLEAQKSGESPSPEMKVQRERKLRALKRAHSRALEDFREEFRFARDRALDKVQNEVYDAIHIVRAQLDIDIIVQEYVSASQRIDITDNVLEYLGGQMRLKQSNRNNTKTQKENNDSFNPQ